MVLRAVALVLALALLLGSCATFPRAPDEGGAAWIRIDTEHFKLDTDLDEATARRLATELERWVAGISAVYFLDLAAPPERISVIAVRSGESEKVHPRIDGMSWDGWGLGPMLYIGARDTSESEKVVKHELVHALLAASIHRVPQWLNEGLAFYLEDADFDAARGELTWGLVEARRTPDAESCPPARDLIQVGRWQAYAVGERTRCSGLLVSMLQARYPAQLGCYLEAIGRSQDPRQSLDRCFPDRASWDGLMAAEAAAFTQPSWRRKLAPREVRVRVSALSNGDVHAALGFLDYVTLEHGDSLHDAARRERAANNLSRALDLDPDNIVANVLVQSLTPGARATAGVVAAHPDDWRAWVLRVGATSLRRPELLTAAKNAIALAPYRPEVLELAALGALAQDRPDLAMTYAEKAEDMVTASARFVALEIVAAERQFQCSAAQALLADRTYPRRILVEHTHRIRKQLEITDDHCPWKIRDSAP